MARSIAARRHGDDFQARLFWLRAALLLDPHSNVIKVAYETGPKSFDDILVEYDPKAAPQDHEGRPILRRHSQCKWHTKAGVFGHADLIDPAFINAERYSLLQRARLAQAQHAPDGTGCRFELVTNWRIKAGDPLLELVRKESDALDLDRLFEGKTERGRMGQVRKLWCDHLGLDHAGLALVARTLAVAEAPESLASLRERLDDRFAAVGMKRVPAGEAGFFYDDLAAKLLAQGRVEFDCDGFRKMAERENLIDPAARPTDALAIPVTITAFTAGAAILGRKRTSGRTPITSSRLAGFPKPAYSNFGGTRKGWNSRLSTLIWWSSKHLRPGSIRVVWRRMSGRCFSTLVPTFFLPACRIQPTRIT